MEEVDGDVYWRTIGVDGAPGVLEVSPGGDGFLVVRAHLPYWEGLIHVVGQWWSYLHLRVHLDAFSGRVRAPSVEDTDRRTNGRGSGSWARSHAVDFSAARPRSAARR
ncbi:hypothetical protein ACQEVF_37915 [Nonomuraea polychroma]|uniref:hypothetical protein n=1 Tax=Nonomuraea polychroma TaxID=46176 RepID=UPI003D8D6D1F